MGFKKVTIFGSTGLIGKLLLDKLINDKDFKLINIVSRKELPLKGNRVNQIIIKKFNSDIIKSSVRGSDIVFSSIGTTQSKVKYNKEEYRKIDHDITLRIAESCKKYDVKKFIYVSTAGANENSKNFYTKLKGEIDQSVIKLNLISTIIYRPSLLLGMRKEKRFGEKIAQVVMPYFSNFMPNNYKPIYASSVAESMKNISKSNKKGLSIFHYDEILKTSHNKN